MLTSVSNSARFIKYALMVPALAAGLWIAPPSSPFPSLVTSAQAAQRGPDSLADVVDQVLDAVVNISASTTVNEQQRSVQIPQLPPGSPFQDFFDEFFGPNGPNGGQGGKGQQRKSSSLGSGFIIDPAGIVVTNNHVIGDANDITVILTNGTRLKAEVVGKDSKVDLAVLRVKPDKPLKSVKFGNSDKARLGDWVIAIGNPFGLGGSVTAGIVSARNRDISDNSYGQYIQTDAAINKGNSGGPLFNMQGEVIGVNTAILSPSGGSIGIGFSVPSDMAKPVIEQLIQFGETRRGWLGVRIQNVDDTIAESLGLGTVRGALVADVDPKGPAKSAGIEAGDVIVKFDGQEVKDSKDLPRLVGQTAVGKTVDVVVMRKGKELVKSAKLERLTETEQQAKGQGNKAPDATLNRKFAGLEIAPMNEELRKRFAIKDSVKGVVVTKVEPNSAAADKRLSAGDVIMEAQQETVTTPEAMMKKIEGLKKDGKKSILLLVANPQGETRFVAVPLD
jgi:serine protease Do